MASRLPLILLLSALLPLRLWAADEPRVLASIAPIQSLVAGLMQGVAEPQLLVPASLSPHDYQLRPSQAEQLQQAGVVVWVGPELEVFLQRPLRLLPAEARLVGLLEIPGLRRLPQRGAGIWDAHGHGHGHADHAGQVDPHVWMNPLNAVVVVDYLSRLLSQRYPEHARQFAENASRLVHRLHALDDELTSRFAAVSDRPFLMLHDGFQYLEQRYGLKARGSLMINPEVTGGARRLGNVIRAIREESIACLFREPQLPEAQVKMLQQDTGVRVGELDALGKGLAPGPDAYFEMMRNNAAAITDCLAGG